MKQYNSNNPIFTEEQEQRLSALKDKLEWEASIAVLNAQFEHGLAPESEAR